MRKTGCFLGLLILLFLTGCSGKNGSGPEGKPGGAATGDSPANNGKNAIMETESGYYTNVRTLWQMVYYDKETGISVPLCAKPECGHTGEENCAAAFPQNRSINTVLYEGSLYVYAVESVDNLIGFVLYRVAADASFVDRIATILEVENTTEAEVMVGYYGRQPEPFIIHKGCAYLPYYLRIGKASSGFKGGGLMKVDLQTGEKTVLYEMESMLAPAPYGLAGCGDYVYFNLDERIKGVKEGTVRYGLKTGEIENTPYIKENQGAYAKYIYVTEEVLYMALPWSERREEGKKVIYFPLGYTVEAYEAETGNPLDQKLFISYEEIGTYDTGELLRFFPYKDKYIVCMEKMILVYGQEGTLEQQLPIERYGNEIRQNDYYYGNEKNTDFKICGEQLYRIESALDKNGSGDELYHVYRIPLEEVLTGSGEWILAYHISKYLSEEQQNDHPFYRDFFAEYTLYDQWN